MQPALMGSALITGPEGIVGAKAIVVSALQQTPEQITDRVPAGATPVDIAPAKLAPITRTPIARVNPRLLSPVEKATPATGGADTGGTGGTIHYGMYVVRNDSHDWVDDAWDFHTNLAAANSMRRSFMPTTPSVVRDQYYWSHVWLMRDGEGQPDHSASFVRKLDFLIIEGHGAPGLITTRGDCCDVIYLNGINGYGANSALGGVTDCILWKSRHVSAAPPRTRSGPSGTGRSRACAATTGSAS